MTDVRELTESWAPPPPPRRRRWPVVVWAAVGGVIVAVIVAMLVRLPYVLISPGDATAVDKVVSIDGARTYQHRGHLLFLTVSVSTSRPNLFQLLAGWLDSDVEIVPENDVLGGRTRKQDARLNRLEMADSQMTAKEVALERLGYAVTETGTGVGVRAVVPGSPADSKLEIGDVITAVDGQPITLSEQLGPLIRARPPGEPVTLTVERDGESRSVSLVTRAAADGPCAGRAQIGVSAATRDHEFDYPIDVNIDTGRVGGPSAGLAFTLTIIDELTPGDLTGGNPVAVTGTIESDGSVGPVGGVAQKAVAADHAGARLFLVPIEEVNEARQHANGMKVVGVDTVDDAIGALDRNGGRAELPPAPERAAC